MSLVNTNIAAQPFAHHLVKGQQKRSARRKKVAGVLMLTSMVDMFSMLVVFLLQTFSSSPEIFVAQGIVLPQGRTAEMILEAPVIALARDGNLYLDQELVGTTSQIVKEPKKLMDKLELIKTAWAKKYQSPFPSEVNLQAHKEVDSTEVSAIMGLLTAGQFQSIQLAVVQGAGS